MNYIATYTANTGLGYDYMDCVPLDNSSSISARIDSDGYVLVSGGHNNYCIVDSNGAFGCFES